MWSVFTIGVLAVLALDLGVLNRKAHAPTLREAATWSAVWVGLSALFGVWVFFSKGPNPGMQFTTGYLIELSLSVDNVFLFAILFGHFKVPRRYQHRVLFWGIVGAVIMRGIMIAVGTSLIARLEWIIYVFGAFLIITGVRMFMHRNKEVDVSEMWIYRIMSRRLRLSPDFDGQKFFTTKDGIRYATPLLLVLVLVELTDVMFAVDSIPAVLAISQDPFIVFTSNIFAILGLRSFYFMLAGVMGMFEYLTVGLSGVLIFVGFKMLRIVHIDVGASLGIVAAMLGTAIACSLLKAQRTRRHARHGAHHQIDAEE
jgi:tellurite resistance protein TerC